MPMFSLQSLNVLKECHPDLQTLFHEVIKYYDCKALVGERSEVDQNKAFNEGKSKLKYPMSKHNHSPSLAIDIVPWPVNWSDSEAFYYFGGLVMGISEMLYAKGLISHKIRWGGDWDRDSNMHNQTLFDLNHFELVE